MKSTAVLVNGHQSVIDNGRNHAVVTDLPTSKNGADTGATALELSLKSFSGCISTIYSVMARKMRIQIDSLKVEMEGSNGDDTIDSVSYEVKVSSPEEQNKLEKCLERTKKNCPVGVLFEKAGVEVNGKLTKV
ncbi:MAG: OsmC family protein [Bacteroidales bacterium]|nr:OsmC family protein [Bacteroidales bacterium]